MPNLLEDLAQRGIEIPAVSNRGITQLGQVENINADQQTDPPSDVSTNSQPPSQTNQVSVADVRKAERARTKEVMSSEHYKGREELAQKMLFDTEMAAAQIIEMLAAAPAQSTQSEQKQTSAFEQAMNQHGQTNIQAEENDEGEVAKSPVTISNNIFDHFGFKNKGE